MPTDETIRVMVGRSQEGSSASTPIVWSDQTIIGHFHQRPPTQFIPGSMAHYQLFHEAVYGKSLNAEHRRLADKIIAEGKYPETSKFKLLGDI